MYTGMTGHLRYDSWFSICGWLLFFPKIEETVEVLKKNEPTNLHSVDERIKLLPRKK